MTAIKKPEAGEYAAYYHAYVGKVPEGDILEILRAQHQTTQTVLAKIPEQRAGFRYAPGKWSIKEVIGHVCDVERVFAYRALCFVRNDPGPFPSIDQDAYVQHGNFANRTLSDIAAEFEAVRQATCHLFASVDEETALRRGIASGFEFTVRALAYIIAGHELHHLRILREKYL